MTRILGVDPGGTTGFVLVTLDQMPIIAAHWTGAEDSKSIRIRALEFLTILRAHVPDVVVVEDYRVYRNTAKTHIGQRLFTSELIGCYETVCGIVVPAPEFARLPAHKKGKWPVARINRWFPEILGMPTEHEQDAARLALTFIEGRRLWEPTLEQRGLTLTC